MDHLAIPIVLIITVFAYLAIEVWADVRRREREACYDAMALLISAVTGQFQQLQNSLVKNATETSGRQSH